MPRRRSQRSAPPFRTGDWVEVRSEEEILSTLNTDGAVDNLPFMPEMLKYCGRRFRVSAVAHKTCDPAHKTGGRRLKNAVHLEGLRCDGASHGGCQALCLLFWKTDWLRPIDEKALSDAKLQSRSLSRQDLERAAACPRNGRTGVYSCQATRLLAASSPLFWWDVRQYVRDITSGNVTVSHLIRILVLSWVSALTRIGVGYRLATALYRRVHIAVMKQPAPINSGPIRVGKPTPTAHLRLQPGEMVRVKSNPEIASTLNEAGNNRGMWFDEEMVPYCGKTFRVLQRVDRIINEATGEMMQMKSPCIALDRVVCKSLYSRTRLFCPRAITPFWRENWLERVDRAPQ